MRGKALITGAASGIGYAFAVQCLDMGYSVILVDKNGDQLRIVGKKFETLFPGKVVLFEINLADTDAAEKIFESSKNERVELLINNAGFGLVGEFTTTEWKIEEQMIHVSIIALTKLCKLFLPQMKVNQKGAILNVASIAGFFPGPYMSIYYATKAYILSFSRALAFELKGSGVHVTVLCPGPVKTNFQQIAKSNQRVISRLSILNSPEKVASFGLKAVIKGKVIAIPGFFNKCMVFTERFLPMQLITNIVGAAQKKNQGKNV